MVVILLSYLVMQIYTKIVRFVHRQNKEYVFIGGKTC